MIMIDKEELNIFIFVEEGTKTNYTNKHVRDELIVRKFYK